jgi:hypothetical protein
MRPAKEKGNDSGTTSLRIQDGNVWQVTVILIVIQPISDNELILDLETAEVSVRYPPPALHPCPAGHRFLYHGA